MINDLSGKKVPLAVIDEALKSNFYGDLYLGMALSTKPHPEQGNIFLVDTTVVADDGMIVRDYQKDSSLIIFSSRNTLLCLGAVVVSSADEVKEVLKTILHQDEVTFVTSRNLEFEVSGKKFNRTSKVTLPGEAIKVLILDFNFYNPTKDHEGSFEYYDVVSGFDHFKDPRDLTRKPD